MDFERRPWENHFVKIRNLDEILIQMGEFDI